MELSAEGLELIKRAEGFRGRTYMDVEGFPTIGYGHRLVHPETFPERNCRGAGGGNSGQRRSRGGAGGGTAGEGGADAGAV